MEAIKIKVHHVGGRIEELVVEADVLRIGSGAHCEVRLPTDQAQLEHVVLRRTPSGVVASARSFDPRPTLDDIAFTDAPVRPGAVLRIHQSIIELSPVALTSEPSLATRGARHKGLRPAIILIFGLGASGTMLASKPRAKDAGQEPPPAPRLFVSDQPTCPQQSEQQAEALAQSKLALAKIKRERSPFHVEDGVLSVPLYAVAAACFRVAGRDDDAREAAAAGEQLRARVSDDFRMHGIRLQHALRMKDWRMAQDEVRTLRAYVSTDSTEGGSLHRGPEASYAVWLSNLERKIELTQGGKKK